MGTCQDPPWKSKPVVRIFVCKLQQSIDMYKSNGTNYMYQQNQITDSDLSIAHQFLLKGACSLQLHINVCTWPGRMLWMS